MNPFDLRGPEFLLFYLGLSILVLVALVILRRARESAREFPQPKLNDPYVIAYLRGGPSAAIESAVVSLIDRGLVVADDDGVRTREPHRKARVSDPLESSLIDDLDKPRKPSKFGSMRFPGVFAKYESVLGGLGLVPDAEEKSARTRDTLTACMFLAAVAGIKIAVALSRGRTNITFLIILAVAALVALIVIGNPRLTRRGKNVLEDLKNLFKGLQSRADSLTPGRAAAELALVAALFGAMTLPISAFPLREKLFPQPTSSGDSGGSSSDGGSSCGGGGGCGGGCGGCGS